MTLKFVGVSTKYRTVTKFSLILVSSVGLSFITMYCICTCFTRNDQICPNYTIFWVIFQFIRDDCLGLSILMRLLPYDDVGYNEYISAMKIQLLSILHLCNGAPLDFGHIWDNLIRSTFVHKSILPQATGS